MRRHHPSRTFRNHLLFKNHMGIFAGVLQSVIATSRGLNRPTTLARSLENCCHPEPSACFAEESRPRLHFEQT